MSRSHFRGLFEESHYPWIQEMEIFGGLDEESGLFSTPEESEQKKVKIMDSSVLKMLFQSCSNLKSLSLGCIQGFLHLGDLALFSSTLVHLNLSGVTGLTSKVRIKSKKQPQYILNS